MGMEKYVWKDIYHDAAIREMQIRNIVSYHFIPTRTATIKKTVSVGEDVETWKPTLQAGR
jgi:hypothetical protein